MAIYRTWSVFPVVAEPVHRGHSQARPDAAQVERKTNSIPVRIRETEGVWIVEADVPGVAAESIGIEHFQDRLTIRYERVRTEEPGSKFDDRMYGGFERIIRITDEIRSGEIAARLENGVLRLEIPKSEALRPRTIPVSQG